MIKEFDTKQDAKDAGYVFLKNAVIEYVKDDNGNVVGKVQRVDVSPGDSFGYNFQLGVFRKTDSGWQRVALFGKSVEIFISTAKSQGGRIGAIYSNVMTAKVYDQALRDACETLPG